MDNVLERMSRHIEDFMDKQCITSARKFGEALCKLYLLNEKKDELAESDKFRILIDSLSSKNFPLIDKHHLTKIKRSLEIILDYGNTDSHDNGSEISHEDIDKVEHVIKELLIYTFDSAFIEFDLKVPKNIRQLIGKFITDEENWRCETIISLVYPNRDCNKEESNKEYSFFNIKDIDDCSLGLLFINRNVCFTQVFKEISNKHLTSMLDRLTILFPLEISKSTGKYVNKRKEYIQKIASENLKKNNSELKIFCDFYEKFIWEKCLPNSIKQNPSEEVHPEEHFIDQYLHIPNDRPKLSLEFIRLLTENNFTKKKKPLYIIFGEGGVGKTTFCEQAIQLINQIDNSVVPKRAILLSSYDIFSEQSHTLTIDSVYSLYKLLYQSEDQLALSQQALELNISSGNIIIVIDGLDEIISKLKDKFNLEKFIQSTKQLNDTYQNTTIIITSREIDLIPDDSIEVFQLQGFEEDLINKYLNKVFKSDSKLIGEVQKNIKGISKENNIITPLILKLLCDLAKDLTELTNDIESSKYFLFSQELDNVLYQLITREIAKQSLNISPDDYFDIIKQIAFEFCGNINKNDLEEILELTYLDNKAFVRKATIESFTLSPIFTKSEPIRFRYDTLNFWIKARYINYIINNFSESQIKDNTIFDVLARECFKGGSLVKEIQKFKKNINNDYGKYIINNIINNELTIQHRKIISAILYLFISPNEDKQNNTESLLSLFTKDKNDFIEGLSIFGKLYPFDFTKFKVRNGYFDGYESLAKSKLPEKLCVFYDSVFTNIQDDIFGKNSISQENFDKTCSVCETLEKAINRTSESKQNKVQLIRDDLKRVFNVGFKNNIFSWKSISVYKEVSLKQNINLTSLLDIIVASNMLIKEKSNTSSDYGYKVNSEYITEVKNFLTQSFITPNLKKLIEKLATF